MYVSSGFQTFSKHRSQISDEEEQIIAPAGRSNEHNSKNQQEVYCSCEQR